MTSLFRLPRSFFPCCLFVLLVLPKTGVADVSVAGMFNDYCILQRDIPLPVWGWADPQEQVTVELNGQKESAQAGADGRWQVNFKPMSAGGPYTLDITGSKNSIHFKDVLIGEVWVGVGQSNMMMGLDAAAGHEDALKEAAKYPLLRMGYQFGNAKPEPQKDIGRMGWQSPNGSMSATCTFFGLKLAEYFSGKVPVGVVSFSTIEPVQAYCDPKLFTKDNPQAQNWDTGVLYNGVILPVAPYGIRGVLYYQGEMNAGPDSHWKFGSVFPLAIQSWRQAFHNPTLPFLFVQLAGYQENVQGTDHKMDMSMADIAKIYGPGRFHGYIGVRQAETDTLKTVPNTGMAVAIDTGERWNIHPHDKKSVGERLFLQARHVAYKDDSVVYSGPFMRSVEFKGGKAVVSFDLFKSKLVSRGEKIQGFELAGTGQEFTPADATIQGDQVIVSTPTVKEPVALHYAWAGYAFPEPNLFNTEGLPAAPFRYYDFAKLQMPSRSEYQMTNPDFNPVDGWSLGKGAVIQKDADGHNVVMLPPTGELRQAAGALSGFNFNSDAFALPYNVRPGNVIGYAVDMAAEPGKGPANGYFRLSTAGPLYLDNPSVSTSSDKFVTCPMVINVDPKATPGRADVFFVTDVIRQDGVQPPNILLRKFSPVTILRPNMSIANANPIDLGSVAASATTESKPIVISNSQKNTLPSQTSDDAKLNQNATVLYGLADVLQDGMGEGQVFADMKDNVGAILIGPDVASFEVNSPHATADKHGVQFLGQDNKPGLSGGDGPESESFTVRFLGSAKPGTYKATLRIVTQAVNAGTLSQGKPGEPPVHLYYLDIPVTVKVSG